MEKTGKPAIGGILNIVAGGLNILGFFGIIVAIISLSYFELFPGFTTDFDVFPPDVALGFIQSVLWAVAIYLLVTGVVPIIGGIYALQRKRWGLALAGAIVAILGSTPLGIAATVLIASSKNEFST